MLRTFYFCCWAQALFAELVFNSRHQHLEALKGFGCHNHSEVEPEHPLRSLCQGSSSTQNISQRAAKIVPPAFVHWAEQIQPLPCTSLTAHKLWAVLWGVSGPSFESDVSLPTSAFQTPLVWFLLPAAWPAYLCSTLQKRVKNPQTPRFSACRGVWHHLHEYLVTHSEITAAEQQKIQQFRRPGFEFAAIQRQQCHRLTVQGQDTKNRFSSVTSKCQIYINS